MRLLEAKNRRERRVKVAGFTHLHPLGDRVLEDGTRVIANEKTVLFLKDGRVVKEEPNDVRIIPTFRFDPAMINVTKPTPPDVDDEKIFTRWVELKNVNKYIEREARLGWEALRIIAPGKKLRDLTREDGTALAQHFYKAGNKSATVQKKLSHLRVMVNIAVKDGKLDRNPFSDVVPQRDDATEREPFVEEQMALARQLLPSLRPEDALVWRILATTGMRLSEAMGLDHEHDELGHRYWMIGEKTITSKRRVPIPKALELYLPKKITGPLFAAHLNPSMMSKRLMSFIRNRLKIADEAIVVHSLRHRAKDRLRAVGCPEEIQEWILGHDKITAGDGYGKGPPVSKLVPWINRIGW
ncbi:site-specific integrase [Alsobacter soli]|nr:tyrosine-type recombinase/integrase [Alsobacter soli]